jgi:hypothetical protein
MCVANRLLLCRVSLVLLSLLPTAAVSAWILAGATGGYWLADKTEWERVLTERLGLVAQIDHVRYTGQGSAELIGLRLLDAEARRMAGMFRWSGLSFRMIALICSLVVSGRGFWSVAMSRRRCVLNHAVFWFEIKRRSNRWND